MKGRVKINEAASLKIEAVGDGGWRMAEVPHSIAEEPH
jgi:hypothetical protein